jgi:hypothetical protein
MDTSKWRWAENEIEEENYYSLPNHIKDISIDVFKFAAAVADLLTEGKLSYDSSRKVFTIVQGSDCFVSRDTDTAELINLIIRYGAIKQAQSKSKQKPKT